MSFFEMLDKHSWIITLLMVPVTVGIAAWQINRQFAKTILAQRTNKLDELHLTIYKEIADKIEMCESALSKAHATVLTLPSFFEMKIVEDQKAVLEGKTESSYPILQRYPTLVFDQQEILRTLSGVIGVMDKYEIAFTEFYGMKEEISKTGKKLNGVTNQFNSLALQFLPVDIEESDRHKFGGAKVVCPPMPDKEALSAMKVLSRACTEVNMDLSSYIHDLRVEAQNCLLSSLFGNKKAAKRVPGNPKYQVLSRTPSD
ncbi:hypothetical protein [Geomonas ferrireducens]|uniref:hypothetical protein n=1 Tax=Geomonas ferrireducens TaxID=2570227 RepID=UPI0010A796C7|nr:hypothetical protein [Geomonas ferrireducens]